MAVTISVLQLLFPLVKEFAPEAFAFLSTSEVRQCVSACFCLVERRLVSITMLV
jgi:hypothetical protein